MLNYTCFIYVLIISPQIIKCHKKKIVIKQVYAAHRYMNEHAREIQNK